MLRDMVRLGFPWPLCLKRGGLNVRYASWLIRGWSLQVVFSVPCGVANRSERVLALRSTGAQRGRP